MKKELEKVAKTSENIENENLQKLRAVFPNFVKDGLVDFDALQKFFDKEGISAGEEKFGLNWAGKSNAFRAIRTPATGTLVPQPEESRNWDSTENIFIEGDNLEVLKLLQKNYREKIKMIYIDPPYNTGKDFVYKDNFTQDVADYYEQTGQTKGGIKMMANTEKNGRYHSDWLTMMYPRLFLGRNLLKDDGVIFVSIDDNEVANLRMIMDEIFGEENFEGMISWRRRSNQPNDDPKMIATVSEYIVCYAKNSQLLKGNKSFGRVSLSEERLAAYTNPDNDPMGEWSSTPWFASRGQGGTKYEIITPTGKNYSGTWLGTRETFDNLMKNGRIIFPDGGNGKPRKKIYRSERIKSGQAAINFWFGKEYGDNLQATSELKDLFNEEWRIFDHAKPLNLIKTLLKIVSKDKEFIALDFFAGSGTTAHAVMDLNEDGGNRKWICVQLPEITDEDGEAYKDGYKTIAEISKERIRRAGAKIGKGDIGFKSYKLSSSNYRQWNTDIGEKDEKEILKTSKLFLEKPLVDKYDEKSVVYEILVKEGFDLNSKIEQPDVAKAMPGKDKSDLKPWIVIDGDKRLFITFSTKVTKEQVEELRPSENDTFVCFDSALDDTTKVNIGRNVNVKVI